MLRSREVTRISNEVGASTVSGWCPYFHPGKNYGNGYSCIRYEARGDDRNDSHGFDSAPSVDTHYRHVCLLWYSRAFADRRRYSLRWNAPRADHYAPGLQVALLQVFAWLLDA